MGNEQTSSQEDGDRYELKTVCRMVWVWNPATEKYEEKEVCTDVWVERK